MTSLVERALEMARSGNYKAVVAIERRLQRDGYNDVQQHLHGQFIRRQILDAMKHANSKALNIRPEQTQVISQR